MSGRRQPWFSPGLRFTCTECGQCCTGPSGVVRFSKREMREMAECLGLTVQQFKQRYTERVHGLRSLKEVETEHGYDCALLRRTEDGRALCSVYPARPEQCRTYPFWPENLRSRKAWERTADECPGVANGLEGEGEFVPVEQVRIQRDRTPW